MAEKNYILTAESAAQKIQRLSLEVAEQLQSDNEELVIIGVRNSGLVIAHKIGELVKKYISSSIKIIDASMDKTNPVDIVLSETIDFNNKNILICDDVANSGRTLLYMLKPLLNYHPKRIQTLVLVERMHKLFPVKPDYVGLSIATTLQENIVVEIEGDEVTGAFIQ